MEIILDDYQTSDEWIKLTPEIVKKAILSNLAISGIDPNEVTKVTRRVTKTLKSGVTTVLSFDYTDFWVEQDMP